MGPIANFTATPIRPAVVPPPSVAVAMPVQANVADWTDLTGQFSAVNQVMLRAQVSGYLTEIHFKDGQIVHKGDLLFVIDPRSLRDPARTGERSVPDGIGHMALANKQLERSARLNRVAVESDEHLDESTQSQRAAAAAVKAAEAAIHAAELNIEFTHIVAPFSGRVSRRHVSIGSLITGGPGATTATELTIIVSLDPIYLDFDLSEADLRGLSTFGRSAAVRRERGSDQRGRRAPLGPGRRSGLPRQRDRSPQRHVACARHARQSGHDDRAGRVCPVCACRSRPACPNCWCPTRLSVPTNQASW